MGGFEATIAELDQQAVDQTFQEITAYMRHDRVAEWAEVFSEAVQYVDSLYETFTPELDRGTTEIGSLIGAVGLAYVELRYGRDEMSPKLYSGRAEENVIATYHHAGHSRGFLRNMFRYAQARNRRQSGSYDADDFVRFPGVAAFHDAIMGNGRGADERQSALLAATFMRNIGMTLTIDDEPTKPAIEDTAWDEKRKTQAFDASAERPILGQAAAVADLLPLFDVNGPYQGICLFPEDYSKKQYGQLFAREAAAAGFVLARATVEDCLRFVDQRPALQTAYAGYMHAQTDFVANLQPADPDLDQLFAGRSANVRTLRYLDEQYSLYQASAGAEGLSALGTLHAARAYQEI